MNRFRILAVDDEQPTLNAIYRTLRREFEVSQTTDPQLALQLLAEQEFALLLADQRMPGLTGVELLQRAAEIAPQTQRVLITGYSDIEATIDAINRARIFYYIHKPWEPEELQLIVRRAVEQYRLIKENERLLEELRAANQKLQQENILLKQNAEMHYRFENIIGAGPAMKRVLELVKKVIPTDTTVLLIGETGTGKELIAQTIHYNGPRRDKLFVAQNCAALPEPLLESELFGHVKGAFTGAIADKKGLFELADGGTIFLDEIGDTSPALQQRLLRVLQEGEIRPVGSEQAKKVDVRVISATNRDLKKAIENGQFREDLYYRLNVFPIHLPPLRDRREDIPMLAGFFLEKLKEKQGRAPGPLTPEAMALLLEYPFPGNVRELQNLLERAVTLAGEGEPIRPEHFNLPTKPSAMVLSGNLKEQVEQLEKQLIRKTLSETGGNISRAARLLGISRVGLQKKLKRYHLSASQTAY